MAVHSGWCRWRWRYQEVACYQIYPLAWFEWAAAVVDMNDEAAGSLARQVEHGRLMQLTDVHAVLLSASEGVAPTRCFEPSNNCMKDQRMDVWPNKLRAWDADAIAWRP